MSSYDSRGWFIYEGQSVLVHADGGVCHGTPLVNHQCPVCFIHPDMQSTEFWRFDKIKTPPAKPQPSITCPVCQKTSYNENDIANGYCGYCHDFTGRKVVAVRTSIPQEQQTEVEWAYDSPSKYWTITKVQPAHQTGRQAKTLFVFLLIEFSHIKPDGDRIVVEAYVDSKEKMARLGPFLDATVDLPQGIRIRAHTVEKAPWDVMKR